MAKQEKEPDLIWHFEEGEGLGSHTTVITGYAVPSPKEETIPVSASDRIVQFTIAGLSLSATLLCGLVGTGTYEPRIFETIQSYGIDPGKLRLVLAALAAWQTSMSTEEILRLGTKKSESPPS